MGPGRHPERGRWVETGTEPGAEVRQLSAGTATLQDRTRYIEADGDRAEIDTDVNSVTAAP